MQLAGNEENEQVGKKFSGSGSLAKSTPIVLDVYQYTSGFPRNEEFCLTAQFRRAAVSVPANIAEGFKKKSKAEKIHYLNIAQGSLKNAAIILS